MNMQALSEDELNFLVEHIRKGLHSVFLGRTISSAGVYFTVWRELRKVLEEELNNLVNKNIEDELEKIRGI